MASRTILANGSKSFLALLGATRATEAAQKAQPVYAG